MESLRGGSARSLERAGVEVIYGSARFIAQHTLEVTKPDGERRQLSGETILIDTGTRPFVPRITGLEETPFMKAVVDGKSQRILGAAVLGAEGGELASMLQIAMMGNLPYTALRDGMFAHPTLAESLNNLFRRLEPQDAAA